MLNPSLYGPTTPGEARAFSFDLAVLQCCCMGQCAHLMDWLTREQIDEVVSNLSAADLIEGTSNGRKDAQVAGAAFDSAAKRMELSNGTPATQHVRAADFAYLAEKIGEAVNIDSPLSPATSDSPDSAAAGE